MFGCSPLSISIIKDSPLIVCCKIIAVYFKSKLTKLINFVSEMQISVMLDRGVYAVTTGL